METQKKNRISVKRLWQCCPARHSLLVLSWSWLAFYFLFRDRRDWMNAVCRRIVRPWHSAAGRFYSLVRFSAAEWLYVLWILMAVGFLVQLVLCVKRRHSMEAYYRWFISVLTMASTLFALFCLWWGVLYYSDSFTRQAGLDRRPISVDDLQSVTEYFAQMANDASSRVERDERGVFTADYDALFEHSTVLYHAVEEEYPCLSGPDLRAKPAVFSKLMSWLNNTGYFCPYTAEANVNVDCTMALIPATIAHELAHQRGVAREDEANFAAVLACLSDGDDTFTYSGALMAYVYLGNALHSADYQAWLGVYESLNEQVRRDLSDHNAYWDRYETPVADASDRIYEGFLKTYGDDRGMKSYDACVDLLVLCFLDAARR